MEQCSICLESLDGGVVALAACGHRFQRHERHVAARRVVAPVQFPPARHERKAGSGGEKHVEMRRVGDSEWRCFGSRRDAAKAFGVSHQDVSYLINDPSRTLLRETFEARPAPPRKRERPTSAAPRKRAKFQGKRVEGAQQRANGKWGSPMFPGRQFDDLAAYRVAKKQRAARMYF